MLPQHFAARTDSEEEYALALALSESMAQNGRSGQQWRPSGSTAPTPAAATAPARQLLPSASATASQTRPPAGRAAGMRPSSGGSAGQAPQPQQQQQQQQQPSPRRMFPDPASCAGCGKGFTWGASLTALNRRWHPACFVCGFCSKGVNDGGNTRFAVGHEDGWPYHMECYKLKYHPVCCVCRSFVPAQPDGRVEYKQQGFWREAYCTVHAQDGTPQCCSCSRYQPKGTDWATLSDSRQVCFQCLSTVVMDTREAQPLYQEVMSFYRNMGMPHPEVAPLMLVDAFTLDEYSGKEGKDVSGGPVFHVRGLTLATVYQSIPSIVKSTKDGGKSVSSIATALSGRGHGVSCTVSAVLVLYGLPRLLTGCIIAHELMHAWLRMKNVAGLDSKVEEGLCQLMAYVWLDNQANGLTEPDLQRLASFYAYQIREDTSEVYGDGFREAYDAFQQRGLTAVINDVLRRGKFT